MKEYCTHKQLWKLKDMQNKYRRTNKHVVGQKKCVQFFGVSKFLIQNGLVTLKLRISW